MLDFKIDTSELRRKVRESQDAIERDMMLAVNKASADMVVAAKQGKFQDQTGALRASISYTVTGWRGRGYYSRVSTGVPYAWFVEYPTRAHPIDPVKAKMLHWERPQGDHHFARHVEHPGTRGFYFMFEAQFVARNSLVNELQGKFVSLRSVWNS
jgi:Bacteriophage HK97-gp10, putative tail-component